MKVLEPINVKSVNSALRNKLKIVFSATEEEANKVSNLEYATNQLYDANSRKISIEIQRDMLYSLLENLQAELSSSSVDTLKQLVFETEIHFSGRGFDFDITTQPLIYSILNLTPDSFYDGGVNNSISGVLKRIESEREAGAQVFEVGGKSSKPHFDDISPEAEWSRLAPYLKEIHANFPDIVLAIDSNTPEVIKLALDDGIQIINDIDGFNSKSKLDLVKEYQPAVVSMFNGRDFNEQPDTLIKTMDNFFDQNLEDLLATGIKPENIVLDPGVGFSDHNTLEFDLIKMKYTKLMTRFNVPIMIAISRKSFASRLFELDSADDRLLPTLLFESLMSVLGGRVIRVHDVKETAMMTKIFELLKPALD